MGSIVYFVDRYSGLSRALEVDMCDVRARLGALVVAHPVQRMSAQKRYKWLTSIPHGSIVGGWDGG